MAQALDCIQRRSGRGCDLRPAQVQIAQMRKRSEFGQAGAGDLCLFQVQRAQMSELLQRVEARVGYRGAAQFSLNNIGRELLELRQLRIIKGPGRSRR
jgi:hypothetical protein